MSIENNSAEKQGRFSDSEGNGAFRFKRKEHLKGRIEIREVFGKGRQYSCHGVKLFVLTNNLSYNRICFTLARSFGNAVSRNRAKRLSREAYRLINHNFENGYDLILLIYPEAEKNTVKPVVLSDRIGQLSSLFKKAGLIK